jgi:hypothetical protein
MEEMRFSTQNLCMQTISHKKMLNLLYFMCFSHKFYVHFIQNFMWIFIHNVLYCFHTFYRFQILHKILCIFHIKRFRLYRLMINRIGNRKNVKWVRFKCEKVSRISNESEENNENLRKKEIWEKDHLMQV